MDQALSRNAPDVAQSDRLPKKVIFSSFISTFIEWYDFLTYGTVAALVFTELFFPKLSSLSGTLATLSTFTVGFIARPLGGILFGHYGDLIGRKKMLITTLLLMAAATTGIGVLPTYGQIGIWAPLLLVLLRFIQGVAVGGEWGGAALMLVEQASPARRGFVGSWAQIGGYLGPLVGTGVLAVLTATTTHEQFVAWGWRVVFLLSIPLFFVGLYVRISIAESTVFERAEKTKVPLFSVLKENSRQVLAIMAVHGAESLTLFVVIVYLIGYLKGNAGFDAASATTTAVSCLVAAIIASMFGGWVSDYIGRAKVQAAGLVLGILVAFPLFWTAHTGSTLAVSIVTFLAGFSVGLIYGPEPAYFGELFPTKHRYTGVSVGVQIGTLLAGGTAPILATLLTQWTGNVWGVSVLVITWQVLGLIGLMVLGETRGRSLDLRA